MCAPVPVAQSKCAPAGPPTHPTTTHQHNRAILLNIQNRSRLNNYSCLRRRTLYPGSPSPASSSWLEPSAAMAWLSYRPGYRLVTRTTPPDTKRVPRAASMVPGLPMRFSRSRKVGWKGARKSSAAFFQGPVCGGVGGEDGVGGAEPGES
jgi:hypothetical protein